MNGCETGVFEIGHLNIDFQKKYRPGFPKRYALFQLYRMDFSQPPIQAEVPFCDVVYFNAARASLSRCIAFSRFSSELA